jgi:lysophospholipase L1-like esterase
MILINRLLAIFMIALLCFLIAITAVEIILRIIQKNDGWSKLNQANVLRNFDFNYSISGLYESDNQTVNYSRDEFGLRDDCKDPSQIKILTVGSSTSDQRYVELKKTYQEVLENLIRVNITKEMCISNAGVDGHSTYGNIFAFNYWFPLIPNLRPDYILLYLGGNDANFVNPVGDSVINRTAPWKVLLKELYITQNLLPLYRFLRDGADNEGLAYSGHFPKRFTIADYTISSLNPNTPELSALNAEKFRLRIKILLEKIEALGSTPICVTQPHRYSINVNGKLFGVQNVFGKEYSGIDYDYSIRALNDVMAQQCGNNLVYIESNDFNAEHFYDGVHTSSEGSKLIGKKIYASMKSKFLAKYK